MRLLSFLQAPSSLARRYSQVAPCIQGQHNGVGAEGMLFTWTLCAYAVAFSGEE